jgi:hypothetical protein
MIRREALVKIKFAPGDRVELTRKVTVQNDDDRREWILPPGERATVVSARLRPRKNGRGWAWRWIVTLDDSGHEREVKGSKLRRLTPRERLAEEEADRVVEGFRRGDRVIEDTLLGFCGTVVSMHPHKRDGGIPSISVEFDDGKRISFAHYLLKHAPPVVQERAKT